MGHPIERRLHGNGRQLARENRIISAVGLEGHGPGNTAGRPVGVSAQDEAEPRGRAG